MDISVLKRKHIYYRFHKYKKNMCVLPIMLICVLQQLCLIDYDTTGELLFFKHEQKGQPLRIRLHVLRIKYVCELVWFDIIYENEIKRFCKLLFFLNHK